MAVTIGRDHSLFAGDVEAHHATLREAIRGKRVLAIGAAGTIGAAFLKALLRFEPGRVVIIDCNENALTELVRDCRSSAALKVPDAFLTYAASYAEPIFSKIVEANGPFEIVANFAAHKHVRSEKDLFAVEALITNNLFNAQKLLEQLSAIPPEHFFSVSTDKAADPVSVMGASKRVLEDLVMSFADVLPVTTARFANVAFSNGSLLHGYLHRLARSQPLSVPRDTSRYFVSPKESGEMCLLSCILGSSGDVFVPKVECLPPPRNLLELTDELLISLGFRPKLFESEHEARLHAGNRHPREPEYPVYVFDSDTSGEKSVEVFSTYEESLDLSRFESLAVIATKPYPSRSAISKVLDQLRDSFAQSSSSKAQIVAVISDYLGNFRHVETGKNLDQRM